MQEFVTSRTATGTSFMRALHTRADPLRTINDPSDERLVPESATAAIRHRARSATSADARAAAEAVSASIVDAWLRAIAADATAISRSRLTGDVLDAVIAQDRRNVGLEFEEDLDDVQVVKRYDPLGTIGLRPPTRSRFVRARVADARARGDA